MIHKNQLRIGNYVIAADHKETSSQMQRITEGWMIDACEWRGIPMSVELLTKMGYTKASYQPNWNASHIEIWSGAGKIDIGVFENEFFWYNSSDDDYYSSYDPKFEFIHQIQNFNVDYIGKELEITQ